MNTILSISKNVIRRVWRKRSFWIIQGFLAVPPLVVAIIVFLSNQGGLLASRSGALPGLALLVLYFLVLPLLVSAPILEDFGKAGEIIWSGPLDYVLHFAGLFAGLWVALLAGSLLQLGSWFLADLLWDNLLGGWSWAFSLAIHLLVNTVGLSLVFLLATLVRRSFQLMFIWSALWLVLYFNIYFSASLSEYFFPFSAIAFANLFFHNLSLSPSLLLGLERDQVLGMFSWFLGLSLAAFSLALLLAPRIDRRRASQAEWFAPVLFGISLLAGLGGFALNNRAVRSHALPPSPYAVQIDAWEPLSQTTRIDVDASTGALAGSSLLQLASTSRMDPPEVVLRLNTGLSLTQASLASGEALPSRRVGDSVIITLPAPPEAPVTLQLAWQGFLHIPYSAFEQRWQHFDAPYPYAFVNMPTALTAYLQPEGGFIRRDGDWMPWPWTTTRQQAGENHLTIRAQGGEVAASAPVQNGEAVWEGPLPDGLLAFLPQKRLEMGEMILASSPFTGSAHSRQASLFAAAAARLADLFGEPPPSYVIVAPYLNDLVWSGDLLLIPDGSGYYLSNSLGWLYQPGSAGLQQPEIERATITALARAYLLGRAPVTGIEFQPILGSSVDRRTTSIASISEADWQAEAGRWVRTIEAYDVVTHWNGRSTLTLSEQGQWTSAAFWLAMELANEQTRQADLELLTYFEEIGITSRGYDRDQYLRAYARAWPRVLETRRGREIVLELHRWAETVGTEQALSLFAAVIQEAQPEGVKDLLTELEQRSGLPIGEEQP